MSKICRNNKTSSFSNSDTIRNNFVVQTTNNPIADEMREELAKMRTELGLVLKHVSIHADYVNAVNYLTKQPLVYDYYYDEDAYTVNDRWGVSHKMPKAIIRKMGPRVKETKVRIMVTRTEMINMSEIGSTTATTTLIEITIVN